jgi:hypothetical protein
VTGLRLAPKGLLRCADVALETSGADSSVLTKALHKIGTEQMFGPLGTACRCVAAVARRYFGSECPEEKQDSDAVICDAGCTMMKVPNREKR